MKFEEMINRFPEELVTALKSTPQPLEWHPEGCVYNHIRLVWEEAEKLTNDTDILIAALFHDLGKIERTFVREDSGKIVAYGHEAEAIRYIKAYADLFPEARDWMKVDFICANHMKMHLIDKMRPFKKAELEASPYWKELVIFGIADDSGRGS